MSRRKVVGFGAILGGVLVLPPAEPRNELLEACRKLPVVADAAGGDDRGMPEDELFADEGVFLGDSSLVNVP